jgi:hypothetical protein
VEVAYRWYREQVESGGSLDWRVAVEKLWEIRDVITHRYAEDADMLELEDHAIRTSLRSPYKTF